MKAAGKGAYDAVIVIGPSHRAYFKGAAIMGRGGYRTPLGTVDIDEDLAAAILKADGPVAENVQIHGAEHSLEVQVPFLQTVFGEFRLVPIVMGSQERDVCEKLAAAMLKGIEASGRRTLIVGSTDLSHYHSYAEAVKLDRIVVDLLGDFDIGGLEEEFEKETCEACGRGPIMVTMMLSKALARRGAGFSSMRIPEMRRATGEAWSVTSPRSSIKTGGPGNESREPVGRGERDPQETRQGGNRGSPFR